MHSRFDIASGVAHVLEEIRAEYESAIDRFERAKGNPQDEVMAILELKRRALRMSRYPEWGQLLPSFFILDGEFRLAWIAYNVLGCPLDRFDPTSSPEPTWFIELPQSWDLELFWREVRKIPIDKRTDEYPRFDFEDDTVADERTKSPLTGWIGLPPYDLDPSVRYDHVRGDPRYYISRGGVFQSISVIETLMNAGKHAEAEEVIFRVKHALCEGEFREQAIVGKLKHNGPVINCFDHWLRARLETDPAHRKIDAWIAIYWLIRYKLNELRTNVCIIGDIVELTCCIIADTDLLEEKQAEFLRYFKIVGLRSCPATARKLMADPVKPIRYDEIGIPSTYELKKLYAAKYGKRKKKTLDSR